jgi:hypothetical protein
MRKSGRSDWTWTVNGTGLLAARNSSLLQKTILDDPQALKAEDIILNFLFHVPLAKGKFAPQTQLCVTWRHEIDESVKLALFASSSDFLEFFEFC